MKVDRRLGAALVLALVLAGCGGDDDDAIVRSDDPEVPATSEAPPDADLFAIEDPDVTAVVPDPLLVPPADADADLALVDVALPEGPPPEGPPAEDRGAQTLWVDPDDPERALVVGRTERTDIGGGFPNEGEEIEVGGVGGVVSDDDGLVVVTLPVEVDPDECECNQTAVVAGRGFSRAEVLDVAEVARPLAERPEIPDDALPDGLRSLGTVPILDPFEDTRNRAEVLTVAGSEADALLVVTQGDPRLVHHLAFWIDGQSHGGAFLGADAAVVQNGGAVILVIGSGLDAATGFAADLVPGAPEDLDAAVVEGEDDEPAEDDEPEDCLPDGVDEDTRVLRSGDERELIWTVGAGVAAGVIESCIETDDRAGGGVSNAFTDLSLDVADDAVELAAYTEGGATGRTVLVLGHVPIEAVEVELRVSGAEDPVRVEAEAHGPAADRRWFIAAVTLDEGEGAAVVTARALDVRDVEVAEGTTDR